MITDEQMKTLVAQAAQEAIREHDSDIRAKVKRLMYKAQQLEKDARKYEHLAFECRGKLQATVERLNRLRDGDWSSLVEEDESTSDSLPSQG